MHVSHEDLHEVLVAAQADLNALQGARVFLTGGTGYIGCWMLTCLLYAVIASKLDIAVTVLSREPRRFEERYPHLAKHPSVER